MNCNNSIWCNFFISITFPPAYSWFQKCIINRPKKIILTYQHTHQRNERILFVESLVWFSVPSFWWGIEPYNIYRSYAFTWPPQLSIFSLSLRVGLARYKVRGHARRSRLGVYHSSSTSTTAVKTQRFIYAKEFLMVDHVTSSLLLLSLSASLFVRYESFMARVPPPDWCIFYSSEALYCVNFHLPFSSRLPHCLPLFPNSPLVFYLPSFPGHSLFLDLILRLFLHFLFLLLPTIFNMLLLLLSLSSSLLALLALLSLLSSLLLLS